LAAKPDKGDYYMKPNQPYNLNKTELWPKCPRPGSPCQTPKVCILLNVLMILMMLGEASSKTHVF
jgi:hypothetical protein